MGGILNMSTYDFKDKLDDQEFLIDVFNNIEDIISSSEYDKISILKNKLYDQKNPNDLANEDMIETVSISSLVPGYLNSREVLELMDALEIDLYYRIRHLDIYINLAYTKDTNFPTKDEYIIEHPLYEGLPISKFLYVRKKDTDLLKEKHGEDYRNLDHLFYELIDKDIESILARINEFLHRLH